AGYLDSVSATDECVTTAIDEGRRLSQIDARAYASTKRSLRQATIDRVLTTPETDMGSFAGASSQSSGRGSLKEIAPAPDLVGRTRHGIQRRGAAETSGRRR